ncbi:MAG: hypothetical protein ACRDTD_09065, partial [Pseudonocardiaceae bacterium]
MHSVIHHWLTRGTTGDARLTTQAETGRLHGSAADTPSPEVTDSDITWPVARAARSAVYQGMSRQVGLSAARFRHWRDKRGLRPRPRPY